MRVLVLRSKDKTNETDRYSEVWVETRDRSYIFGSLDEHVVLDENTGLYSIRYDEDIEESIENQYRMGMTEDGYCYVLNGTKLLRVGESGREEVFDTADMLKDRQNYVEDAEGMPTMEDIKALIEVGELKEEYETWYKID